MAAAHIVEMGNGCGHSNQNIALPTLRLPVLESPCELLRNKASRKITAAPAGMLHERGKERDIVLYAIDVEGVQCGGLPIDRRLTCGTVSDELGDHGVVMERNFAALL